MAAFQPENFSRAADVPMVLIQFLKNVVALVSRARLMQGQKVSAAPASIAIYQRRKVLAIESNRGGIHDHNPFNHIAKLAHIAGPRVAHEPLDRIIGDFPWPPAIAS